MTRFDKAFANCMILATALLVVMVVAIVSHQAMRESMERRMTKLEDRMAQNESVLATVSESVNGVAEKVTRLDPKHRRRKMVPSVPTTSIRVE